PSVLRADRRRGPLPDREGPARHVQRRRMERRRVVRSEERHRARRQHRGARLLGAMKVLSSLRSRIFLASAVLAVLCIGMAVYLVSVRVTDEAERTIEREISTTGAQVDQLRSDRTELFMLMARLIADVPQLKAALGTDDPPTVADVAVEYQTKLRASLFLLTNKRGDVMYSSGGSPRAAEIAAHQPAVREALGGFESLSLLPQPTGILQI